MDQINAYGAAPRTSNTGGYTSSPNGSSLGMDDFMSLLATQLSNQDVMNPMQDTDFIAQMAQFTSLEAMQTMTEISYAQYGASMIGKPVSVAAHDEMGNYVEDKGVVSSVKFAGGECLLEVNGKEYTISSVMEVLNKLPDPPKDPEKPDQGLPET